MKNPNRLIAAFGNESTVGYRDLRDAILHGGRLKTRHPKEREENAQACQIT
jgi:hypothetical protein